MVSIYMGVELGDCLCCVGTAVVEGDRSVGNVLRIRSLVV
jgi:hypothetical protein